MTSSKSDRKKITKADIERIAAHIELPSNNPDMPLHEAREQLKIKLASGKKITCPCCGGDTKIYPRVVRKPWIKGLRALLKWETLTAREMAAQTGSRDYPGLGYLGLAGYGGGKWCITPKGREFLKGDIKAPRATYVYQGDIVGTTSEMIGVNDPSIDDGFDLGEMMRRKPASDFVASRKAVPA